MQAVKRRKLVNDEQVLLWNDPEENGQTHQKCEVY